MNPPPSLQVLSGACQNALAESECTLHSSRGCLEHLEVLRSTGEGYWSVWEVCVWLLGRITFCWCFNLSASMAMQGCRVQLEHSDIRQALIMANRAKAGNSRAAIDKTQLPIEKHWAKVQEEKMRGVEYPGHRKVKPVMDRHPAILCETDKNRCHPHQNGVALNPQTCSMCKVQCAPPPDWCIQPTHGPMPPPPGMPPAPLGHNEGAQCSQMDTLPPGYVYSHTALPSTQIFDLDAFAQDSQDNIDYNPDMLTDEGSSTG